MKRINEGMLKTVEFLVAVLATALICVVFINVANRFFFHNNIAWSEELSRFLFIWLTFLGSVLVNANYGHMNLDVIVTALPKKGGYILQTFATAITAAIFGALTYGGYVVVAKNIDWKSSALRVPYGYVYMIVPICFFIMCLQSIGRVVVCAKKIKEDGES